MTTVSGSALLLFFGAFLAPLILGFAGVVLDRERSIHYLVASLLGVGLVKAYFSVPMTEATVLGLVLVNPGAFLLVPVVHASALDRWNCNHAGRVLLVYVPPLLLEAVSLWSLLAG